MAFGDWFRGTGLGRIVYGAGDLIKRGYEGVTSDPGADQERERKRLLYEQARRSGQFADQAQRGYGGLGAEAAQQRAYLGRVARGEDSVSALQLKQALDRNVATQRSMAAGASPQNAAGAARTAALNAARLGSGLAGQQAVAGLQERQAAQRALSDQILGARGQDLQASLGARGTATTGYGAGNAGQPEQSWLEKYGPSITGGLSAIASDPKLKTDIESGDAKAMRALAVLADKGAKTWRYRDPEAFGEGQQLGTTTDDLKRAGLGQAVIGKPGREMVDTGKLEGANTGMIAALAREVARLKQRAPVDQPQPQRLLRGDDGGETLIERADRLQGGETLIERADRLQRRRRLEQEALARRATIDAARGALARPGIVEP